MAFLIALTVLTAIVWWRVLHRADSTTTTTASKTTQSCTSTGAKITLPAPGSVALNILNGADKTGLAATVQSQLSARGFNQVQTGNAKSTVSSVGEIHYATATRGAAVLLSYYFPGAKLVKVAGRTSTAVDVILGKKFSSLAPASSVTSAEAAAAKRC
ncbi:LytR C-terminal domain-containing protein [Jatrophihabitans telluris]|uniref:LytR C-terminal domain-containing protein n=1 Tax=Jatrophihabitans telluris TaxID=2038343 RepID=A0ABY4QUF4_9ACTN|nr:LytR C-terminal domain-containing protein [Jatrophihabitans telluris]UQX86706.1 LytR C-terminal domain-containing protein [Jatrophihabitans telluris]